MTKQIKDENQMHLERLHQAARAAAPAAYAPYSRFAVGAAVMTDNGDIFTGVNVENASFGLTICAERNAIFSAITAGKRRITALAVYTPTETTTLPCGACRQVLQEFAPEAVVYTLCDGPESEEETLSRLLPRPFGPANLAG